MYFPAELPLEFDVVLSANAHTLSDCRPVCSYIELIHVPSTPVWTVTKYFKLIIIFL